MVHVGLSSWIIQDGNYGEFTAGGAYRFALEFYPVELAASPATAPAPYLRHSRHAVHEARGRIIHCTDTVWVIDFGVLAFQHAMPPSWARAGLDVVGRVYLGVDPFFYIEELRHDPGMPRMIDAWIVRRIFLETTPWVLATDEQGREVRTRDVARETFVEVQTTDAWNHDLGNAHYVFDCESQGLPLSDSLDRAP